jgi:hypothetical protein
LLLACGSTARNLILTIFFVLHDRHKNKGKWAQRQLTRGHLDTEVPHHHAAAAAAADTFIVDDIHSFRLFFSLDPPGHLGADQDQGPAVEEADVRLPPWGPRGCSLRRCVAT